MKPMREIKTRIFVCDDCGYERLEYHSSEDCPNYCSECMTVAQIYFDYKMGKEGK